MTTTTSYGTWTNHANHLTAGVEHSVVEALGDFGADYDIDGIVADYRAAINAALPDSVTLSGDEFIGPAYDADHDWDGDLNITEIVEGVDFWGIVARHDTTAN